MTRVALVLGSGGARGYAHIGVIEVLVEAGVDIVAISGSSMGAVVGGLHAAGRLDDYAEFARGLGQRELVRLIDIALSGPGAIKGDKIFGIVNELVGDVRIEELPIPFTAVAVDLLAQRELWFQQGPLALAVRASAAIPSFFVPVVLNGRVLVDGAVLNPIPVAPVAAADADLIVAVGLNGPPTPTGAAPVRESTDEVDSTLWSERLRERAARWFDRDLLAAVRRRSGAAGDDPAADPPRSADTDLRTVDIMQSSYDTMQAALSRHRLADYAPDVLLRVPKTAARTLDFHRADELIEIGRDVAAAALDDIVGG